MGGGGGSLFSSTGGATGTSGLCYIDNNITRSLLIGVQSNFIVIRPHSLLTKILKYSDAVKMKMLQICIETFTLMNVVGILLNTGKKLNYVLKFQ